MKELLKQDIEFVVLIVISLGVFALESYFIVINLDPRITDETKKI